MYEEKEKIAGWRSRNMKSRKRIGRRSRRSSRSRLGQKLSFYEEF